MKQKDGVQIQTEFLDKEGQIMLLKPIGYIDQSNADLLEKTIVNGLESKCYKLIFDLEGLVYMSSAGWGILIGEIKRFRQYGGDLKLVNMNSDLFSVYQMLEFYHIIDEYPTVKEAMESFSDDYDLQIKDQKPDLKIVSERNESPDKNKSKGKSKGKTKGKTKAKSKTKSKAKSKTKGEAEGGAKSEGNGKGKSRTSTETNEESHSQVDHQGNHRDPKDEGIGDSEFIEKEIEMGFDYSSQQDLEYQSTDDIASENDGYVEFTPLIYERKVDVKILPLPEKVRRVVAQFPQLGAFQIKKILNHPDFGNVKIGYLRLRSLLKDLDLDTKEKRFRFYRST